MPVLQIDCSAEHLQTQHLDGANAYDGNIKDHTGESEVRIENGDKGTDYAFDSPAIRIDAETTVVWEWVGGATHTVTHDNGNAFDSGRQSGSGKTFKHRFEDSGVYLYICKPHQAFQRGAVLVE